MEKNFKDTIFAVLQTFKKAILPAYGFCWLLLFFYGILGLTQKILSFNMYLFFVLFCGLSIFTFGIFTVIENAAFKNNKNLFNGFAKAWSNFINLLVFFVLFSAAALFMNMFSIFMWIYILAGVLLLPLIILIAPLIVLRDENPFGAAATSFNMLRGNYFPALGYSLLFGIVSCVIAMLVFFIISAFAPHAAPAPTELLNNIILQTAHAMLALTQIAGSNLAMIFAIFVLLPLTVISPAIFTTVIMLNLENRLNPGKKEELMRKLEKEESYKVKRVNNPGVFDAIPLKKEDKK